MKNKASLAIMVFVLALPAAYIITATLLNFSLGIWMQEIDLP